MQFIIIDMHGGCDIYPLNTDAECRAAQAALADAGIRYAKVYVGNGAGDCHPNGDVIWASESEALSHCGG